MKYLISGARGFLGQAFFNQLPGQKIGFSRSGGAGLFQLDLLNDAKVEAFIKNHPSGKVENFLHCAAVTPWGENPDFTQDGLISKNVAKICKALKVEKLFFMSGWIVYDMQSPVPISEDAPVGPASPYGASKLRQENFFLNELKGTETRVVSLRLSSVYGPGQDSPGLIKNLTQSALQQSPLVVNTATVKRDYLYIDDLIAIMEKLAASNFAHNTVLNVGSGESHSVLEVAQLIAGTASAIHGTKIEIVKPEVSVEKPPLDNLLDTSRLKNYAAVSFTDFKVGITEYVNWFNGTHS